VLYLLATSSSTVSSITKLLNLLINLDFDKLSGLCGLKVSKRPFFGYFLSVDFRNIPFRSLTSTLLSLGFLNISLTFVCILPMTISLIKGLLEFIMEIALRSSISSSEELESKSKQVCRW
jgi:hypothetical protein